MDLFIAIILMATVSMCDCERMCSSISNFPKLSSSSFLPDYTFDTIESAGLLWCVDECYRRRRCRSINYSNNKGTCQLNHKANTTRSQSEDYVYTDIADWTWKLSGACSDHSCPADSVCMEVDGGATCDVIYCDITTANKSVNVDLDARHDGLYSEGDQVDYICPIGYYREDLTCGASGRWTGEARCITPPVGCEGVITCNPSAESGYYWVVHAVSNGTAIKVFCDRRDGWMYPLMGVDEQYNFSVFPQCDNMDFCGTTSFQKVRFSFGKFRLGDKDKHDHATYTCGQEYAPFGWAAGCLDSDDCEANQGTFIINTTGTGIIIDPSLTWTHADVTRQDDNRVVIGRCRARCDLCLPVVSDRFYRALFVFDPHYQPPESEATVLNCPVNDTVSNQ